MTIDLGQTPTGFDLFLNDYVTKGPQSSSNKNDNLEHGTVVLNSGWSPEDLGAVKLMQQAGMTDPLLNGDFKEAVSKGGQQWASLPGSPYGQPTRNMGQLERVYKRALDDCEKKKKKK